MAREFMPKSSALMPYIVVNRDAAVAGVFTVDGEAGTVDLTTKYVQITDYNQRVGSVEAQVTLNTGAITSINGSIGTINTSLNNKANKGVNSDITGLTALSGPLRLGGDAVDAYDAVTFRQLQASSGGGSAVINGVMNNFLGAVEWWQGSTASFPTGYLPASGQTVNRADYPDLWAAINAGVFISTTEANWQATPTARGGYSTGDGSTTFRMPDLNGVQTNSIAALFLRGSSQGDPNSGGLGAIRESAAPNITGGALNVFGSSVGLWESTSGAFVNTQSLRQAAALAASSGSPSNYAAVLNFDASKVNLAYGRNSSTEVRPNSIKGTWIIRVTGAFASANTNFSVNNGDATLPANGTTVYGGEIKSVYQVAGSTYTSATLRSKTITGTTPARSFVLTIGDNSTGVKTWEFTDTGDIIAPAPPAWINATYQNGWTSASGVTKYRKRMGNVEMYVSLTAPSSDATVAFTLPAGYRPTTDTFLPLSGSLQTTPTRTCNLVISSDGSVTAVGTRSATTYYAFISFPIV